MDSRQWRWGTFVCAIAFTTPWTVQRAIAANSDHVQRLLKTNQCPLCDLSGANLENANLFGANLVGANLKGANLSGANLGSANLTDADLTGATLTKTYLYQATLENTNFSQANLSGAYLKEAILQDTNLSSANLQGVNLSRTNLTGIALKGVDLTNANLSSAILSGVRSTTLSREYQTLWTIFGALSVGAGSQCYTPDSRELQSAKEYGFDLVFADLSNSQLKGANLKDAVLFNGNLSGADLSNANLTGAMLTCANLKNANLDGAELKNARVSKAVLEGASLNGVKNATLEEAYTTEVERTATPAQTEAKQYVGAMNRTEQAYYLEKGKFTAAFDLLGLGIKPETKNYRYRIFLYRDPRKAVMTAGLPKTSGLKTYVGLVTVGETPDHEETTYAVLCESEKPNAPLPKMPATFPKVEPAKCPIGFKSIGN